MTAFKLDQSDERDRLAIFLRGIVQACKDHSNCEPLAALSRAYLRCVREGDPACTLDVLRAQRIALEELRNERRTEFRRLIRQGEPDEHE